MSDLTADRRLPWDWYDGAVPANVTIAPAAYVETAFSFYMLRSEAAQAVTVGHGASAYLGTMFDLGRNGRVSIGDYALVNGARIICDSSITIGEYALISWNVVLMDCYRAPIDPEARQEAVRRLAASNPRRFPDDPAPRPIHIGRAVWIGFDCCVLPGVTIGEGAIVGARSVVRDDVEPFTIVAGNPARLVRRLTAEEMASGN